MKLKSIVKTTAISAAALIAASALAVLVAFNSPQALRYLFSRFKPPGLTVKHITGTLAGPLDLEGIVYATGKSRLSIGSLGMDWRPSELFSLHVHITRISIDKLQVITKKTEKKGPPTRLPQLRLPPFLSFHLDNLTAKDVRYLQPGGTKALALDSLSLGASMRGPDLSIRSLRIVAQGAAAVLSGRVITTDDYPFSLKTRWAFTPKNGKYPPAEGRGRIEGTLDRMRLRQKIGPPYNAVAGITLSNLLGRRGGTKTLEWKAAIAWQKLRLPVREKILESRQGMFSSQGNESAYSFGLAADIALTGAPPFRIDTRGEGSPRSLTVENFMVHVLGGRLQGSGRLSWTKTKKQKSAPLFAFAFKIEGSGINTAPLYGKLKGRAGFRAGVSGEISKDRRDINLDIKNLYGRFRGYPLRGRGRIRIRDKDYFIPAFVIHSGTARIFASGSRVNQKWDLSWGLAAKNLSELLPEAGGRLSARGHLTGRGKKPFVSAAMSGTNIRYKKYLAKNLRASFGVDLSGRKQSSVNLTAEGLESGRLKLRRLGLRAAGTLALHRISLQAEGPGTSAALSLEGGYRRGVWNGTLTGLRISEHRYGGVSGIWSLVSPSPLEISKTGVAAALCLAKGREKICLRAHVKRRVRTHLAFTVQGMSLGLIRPLLPPGLEVRGTLNGAADVIYAKEQFTGTADMRLANGAVLYSLRGRKKMRLSFKESIFTIAGANRKVTLALGMPFVEGGGVSGRLIISNLETVSGNVRMDIPSLGIVSAVLPQAKDVRGALKAELRVSGPLKHPDLSGQLDIQKASASLPALGIRLNGADLSLRSAGKDRFLIDGVVHSGPGAINIKGSLVRTPAKIWNAGLVIKGKDFLALKNTMARVEANPDLNVTLADRKMGVTGRVDIPAAGITVEKLPSGVESPSPDVVIVGQKKVSVKAMKLQVSASVTVVLGPDITFTGFGFKGLISGSLAVSETPGKAAIGHGELIVNGRYKAHGQTLTVHRGKILFIGGPVDDPGLDVRAVRKAQTQNGVIAGVHVTGTLKTPKLAVFSEPPMDETDALAYLVLGKPLHSASSSQGSLLYEAATTAGLAGGQFVAARIGAMFGITSVKVEKGPPATAGQEQQATLFLGRYLSPRLYVAYGVGLFQTSNVFRVRYTLTRDWLIQTETGTETGGDLFWKLEW